MKYLKKLLILLGIISISNEFSVFEAMKKESKKINTPQELVISKEISNEQHELIIRELNFLKKMSEKEKKEFYKKMLKDGIFLTGPEQPCHEC